MDLRHNAADDVAVDIGQAAVDAVVANGQSFVVDAEQMQDGGEHVVAACTGFAFPTPTIALAVRASALGPAAGQPRDKRPAVVIAPGLSLAEWHSAKLGGPNNERVL